MVEDKRNGIVTQAKETMLSGFVIQCNRELGLSDDHQLVVMESMKCGNAIHDLFAKKGGEK